MTSLSCGGPISFVEHGGDRRGFVSAVRAPGQVHGTLPQSVKDSVWRRLGWPTVSTHCLWKRTGSLGTCRFADLPAVSQHARRRRRVLRRLPLEFSIDTDSNIPFDKLESCAYDLERDPGRKHQIRPMLIGPDGISKKIAVPFLEPLTAQQPYSALLKCALPGCMKAGLEYYTSTLSFGQDQVRRCTVRLLIFGTRPGWVRVYECAASGKTRLLKDLPPVTESLEFSEYVDVAEHLEAQSARVYVFWRAAAVARHSPLHR